MITERDLGRLTDRMRDAILRAGGRLAGVHYCTHQKADGCACKKPSTTLFENALAGRAVDRASIAMVGDSEEDMEAARRMGFLKILVLSGRTAEADLPAFAPAPDAVKNDLLDAVRWLLRRKS
jgi:D-glycero-D-manno-heptose 1,7-bisphosphate phosphatase